jgi:hypothetical protein
MYFGTNTINDTWSIHTEAQHRNYGLLPNELEQLLLRTGLNYKIRDGLVVTGGYANITNHVYNSARIGPEVMEHRIWQQLIALNYFGKTKLSTGSGTSSAGLKPISKRATGTAACFFTHQTANVLRQAHCI